jgi:glyoxylase-like metal-dependent hydrolase (beta-lactamase superfamily II)
MHPTSFRIGDMTIHRIVESEAPFMEAVEFLPGLTPEVLDEHRSWLEPAALEPATGKLIFCFQSYLVRTPHHVVLIDSCVGNDKNRPTRPNWHMKTGQTYMSALASAGITVEDIDYVMCTHLHPDHVGWNTRLENGCWVPTFPNARYVLRLHRRQCSADRRGKSGRVGPQRSCPQRSCPIAADARAYARPFRRAPRQAVKARRPSFLRFAKQAKKQFCMPSVMSLRIEMRILQHTSRQGAKTRWCGCDRLQKDRQIPQQNRER